jgi:hypothetical protein
MTEHCQRCGAARLLETPGDPFAYVDSQIVIKASFYFGFCATCMADVQEILEHFIAGGMVVVLDGDQTWTYRVKDGKPVVGTPAEVLTA